MNAFFGGPFFACLVATLCIHWLISWNRLERSDFNQFDALFAAQQKGAQDYQGPMWDPVGNPKVWSLKFVGDLQVNPPSFRKQGRQPNQYAITAEQVRL